MPINDDKFAKTSFGLSDNRKEMRFKHLPNEIQIIVEERNPLEDIGWQKSIVTDPLFLSLKKNGL